MNFYGNQNRGSIWARLHSALEKPIGVRCNEIEQILVTTSIKELSGCVQLIIESIFGFVGNQSSDWSIGRTFRQQHEFSRLLDFLAPEGRFLSVIYELSADPSCRLDFPISHLPLSTQALFEAGNIPSFYQDKVPIGLSVKACDSVQLSALEFFFFHFAHFVVNFQSQRPYKIPAWNKPEDALYPVLFEHYLKYFFPLDCNERPRSVPMPRPSVVLAATTPHTRMSPRYMSSPLSPPSYSALFPNRGDESITQFVTSSPVGSSPAPAADMCHMDSETWRSDIFLQMMSQTGNHIRIVRLMVKHLHYFVNTASLPRRRQQVYTSQDVLMQWDELKRRVWPQYVQKKLFSFLCFNFEWWPLDAMFRLVLETWLSYIQPWRYSADRVCNLSDQAVVDNLLSDNRDCVVEEKWQPFIVENLSFYTELFQSFMQRALRMDLSVSKNAFMLARMAKVFALPNLSNILMDAENAIQDYSCTEQSSSGPLFRRAPVEGVRNLGISLTASSVLAQIADLQGPDFKYKPLFSLSTERTVKQLLETMQTASTKAAVSAQMAYDSSQLSWKEWLFGSSVDFNTSKYFCSNDDGTGDYSSGVRATEAYLEQAAIHLCGIFRIERPMRSAASSVPVHYRHGVAVQPPDVACVSGNPTLTPLGRHQLMNGLKKFEIEYDGDPELQPIRSNEFAFLVRLLYALSCFINSRYGHRINALYHRDDFIGHLMQHMIEPPAVSKTPLTQERLNFLAPETRKRILSYRSTPKLSLRRFASYKSVFFSALLYVILLFWRSSGVGEFIFVWTFLVVLYFVLKTILVKPAPLTVDSGSPCH